jgi:DNA-binding NtrC family response regulator
MNETATLPAHPLPNLDLTAKSDAASKATARLNRVRKDHLPGMSPGADWTAVKFLALDEVCDRHVQWVLNRCGGNREAAAQFLGIGRTTLYRYLKKLAVKKRDSATSGQEA